MITVNNKKLFFSFVYIKCLILPKKHLIVDSVNALWLNEKNIEENLGHKNVPIISNSYDKIYKKSRYELVNKPTKQSNRKFLHINLALKITVDCRTDKSCSFKKNWDLNYTMLIILKNKL